MAVGGGGGCRGCADGSCHDRDHREKIVSLGRGGGKVDGHGHDHDHLWARNCDRPCDWEEKEEEQQLISTLG
jgi:hypothetical protein